MLQDMQTWIETILVRIEGNTLGMPSRIGPHSHCNTLQHTATKVVFDFCMCCSVLQCVAEGLQCVAARFSVLQ